MDVTTLKRKHLFEWLGGLLLWGMLTSYAIVFLPLPVQLLALGVFVIFGLVIVTYYKLRQGVSQESSAFEILIVLCFCISLVLLVLFDWSAKYGQSAQVFTQIVRGVLLCILLLYVLRTGVDFGAKGFKIGRVLAAMAAMVGLYAAMESDLMSAMYYFSRILYWIVATIAIYRLTMVGAITNKTLIITISCIVPFCSAYTINHMLNPAIESSQNAMAYTLLWCMPLLLIEKRSIFRSALILIGSVAILLTIKRGAIIALLVSSCVYVVSYARIQLGLREFVKVLVFVLVFGLTVTSIVHWKWEDIQVRMEDISDPERGGSGRAGIYRLIVRDWSNADISHKLLGFGSRSVQRSTGSYYGATTGVYAHSDWLQFLHDYGILGIFVLGSLHVTILGMIREGFRRRHRYTPSLVMGYTILFLVNIYSGHLFGHLAIYLGILLAFVCATFKLNHG